MSDSLPSRSCALLHERRTERPVAKEGSRETGLCDEIEHLARGHDGLGCRDALLREPIDLPGERLDLRDLLGAGRADHSLILLKNPPFILREPQDERGSG